MEGTVTLYGDISPRTAAYASTMLLERGLHIMIAERFGQHKELPRRSSRTIKFRRYLNLPMALAPLAEGQTPPGSRLTHEDVVHTLEQFGDFVTITDVIEDTHQDPVLQETMGLLGEQAAETLETVRFEKLGSGTQVYWMASTGAHGANRAAVNGDIFDAADILDAINEDFRLKKGQYITSILTATPRIATEPIAQAFFVFCHTNAEAHLRASDNFLPVENYADSMKAVTGELGRVGHFRFIASPLMIIHEAEGSGTLNGMRNSSAAVDVYPYYIFAKNAYCVIPLRGKNSVTPMVLNPNSPRGGDPLGQRGTAGWKTYHTAGILNERWFWRVECGIPTLTAALPDYGY
jgi:N4-gp56 family major capsid protein